jgi:very-short-patch-repair endonuclease
MAARGKAVHGGELGRIHPLTGVSGRWLTVFDGIPVVRPELCVYQLCGVVNPWRAERALDTAWALGLVSGRSLRACLNDLAEHGRNGTVVLRTLLDERPLGYVPPTSGIEARFQQIMSDSRLGTWRKQIDSGGETWAGRVDFRHETLPVIAEVLSERYHGALSSERDDAQRRAKLEAAGFVVVEVWDVQVWHRVREATDAVRRGVHEAKRRAA